MLHPSLVSLPIYYDDDDDEGDTSCEESIEIVQTAILRLPPLYRTVIILRIYRGRSFMQIASILGIRKMRAYRIYNRSLARIKREIEIDIFLYGSVRNQSADDRRPGCS